MRNISLFVEDNAHEAFLSSILQRFASEYDVEIDLKSHSVRGGRGKVITELRQYQQDLQRVEQIDKSIERLLKALQRQFRIWQQTEN